MRYELYRDIIRRWRWRLRAVNGKIIATSGEGYWNKADCIHGIALVKQSAGAGILGVASVVEQVGTEDVAP